MKIGKSISMFVIFTALLLSSVQISATSMSQDQIIAIVKEVLVSTRDIPDEAFKMALDSLKGTKTLAQLIYMSVKVRDFEALCSTPVPTNFDSANDFREFKKLVKDKLNPLNWLLDLVTPKWVSFISDTKSVFSAVRIDILERALKESQYESYKSNRDKGYDSMTAYDMQANSKGFYVIRSSAEYKNLSDSQVNEMLRNAMEERYTAEKYAQFILELRANRQKYLKSIINAYQDHISLLVEKAREFAKSAMVNLDGTWVLEDSAGRFSGTMTLKHLDYTTAIGEVQAAGGRINVDAYILDGKIELRFHFRTFAVIDYYLQYPELSQYIVSQGGVLATAIFEVGGSPDQYSGTLYPWYVVYNDSDGLVVKKIVYGSVEETPERARSIYISRR